jgi:hypothetical protein
MPDSFEYRCRSCGETHIGLPAWHFTTPVQALGVPLEEREARVDLTEDGCVIDGREFYVKGLLEIPVRGIDQVFTWGAWVSLGAESFERYCTLFGNKHRVAGESFFSWLCNSVPSYPETQLLKARLHVREYPTRPRIELEPTEHQLAIDQREGISRERAIEMAEWLLHASSTA